MHFLLVNIIGKHFSGLQSLITKDYSLKSYHKNVTLPQSLKLPCPLNVKMLPFKLLEKFVKNIFHWLIFCHFINIRYLHFLICLLDTKETRQWQIQNLESFDSKMAVIPIFNDIWKKLIVFASERDISSYIFQNSRTKLILKHEKIPDIVTNRW